MLSKLIDSLGLVWDATCEKVLQDRFPLADFNAVASRLVSYHKVMIEHLHKDEPNCPKCGAEMEDCACVAMDHGRGSIEMGRYDCPTKGCNTTVLVGPTSEMGDK